MKRMMTNALAIAAATGWVMVGSAQSGTTATQGQEYGSGKSDKAMKFSGCLLEGDTPNSYKLTSVQPVDPSHSSGAASGTTGSGTTGSGTTGSGTTGSGTTGSGTTGSGMGSASMMGQELELVPSGSNVDLRSLVGQRVEITAKPMKSDKDRDRTSSGTTGSGTTGSGTTGSGTTGSGMTGGQEHGHSDMMKKKVQVSAVRSLGGSCSGQ